MKKNKLKKAIIITICVLFFVALVPFLYWLLFCTLLTFDEKSDASEKLQYEEQANINIETYLKEKYPDRKFEIISIKAEEGYNGFNKEVYDTCYATVQEEEKLYSVISNGAQKGDLGINSCSDNVQEKEIEQAIIDELKQLFSLDVPNTETYFNVEFDYERFMFHTKYEGGNVAEFLENNKANANKDYYNIELFAFFYCVDSNIIFSEDISRSKEILDNLNVVAWINFKNNIPDNYRGYYPHYISNTSTADDVLEDLKHDKIDYNMVYGYDKETKQIRQY